MITRNKLKHNLNDSKNTRALIGKDFSNYKFNRHELAHISRYLLVCEFLIERSKQKKKPLRILDIGCGDVPLMRTLNASFLVKKSEVVKKYVGVDIDDIMLKQTEKTKPKSISIELLKGDITTGFLSRFTDDSFDVIVFLETIEHIKPEFVLPVLKEFRRIGEEFIISTPNSGCGVGVLPKDHLKEWKYSELLDVLNSAGIKVEKEIGIFCNLNLLNKICLVDPVVKMAYEKLKPTFDKEFLSLTMARFLGRYAQNILKFCCRQ